MESVKSEIINGATDVVPEKGSRDDYLIRMWQQGDASPELSLDFRLNRAFRIIPITTMSQMQALNRFDHTVNEIETCVSKEERSGSIAVNWSAGGDVDSCETCGFRFFCPDPYPRGKHNKLRAPDAP